VAFASVDPSAAADAQVIGLLAMSGCGTSTDAEGASSSASRTVLPLVLDGAAGEDYGGLAGQMVVVVGAFLLNAMVAAVKGSERGRFPSVAIMIAGLAAKGFGLLAGRGMLAPGPGLVAACCAVGCVALFVASEWYTARSGRSFVPYDAAVLASSIPKVFGPAVFAPGRWEPIEVRKRFSSTFGGYRPLRTWGGTVLVLRSAVLGALVGVRGTTGSGWCDAQPYAVAAVLFASGLAFALTTPKRQPLLNATAAVTSLFLAGAWGSTAAVPGTIAPLLFVTAASLGSMGSSAGALALGFVDRRVARAHKKCAVEVADPCRVPDGDTVAAPLLTMPVPAASNKTSLGVNDDRPQAHNQPAVVAMTNPLRS
jgi:hypothetical protein